MVEKNRFKGQIDETTIWPLKCYLATKSANPYPFPPYSPTILVEYF